MTDRDLDLRLLAACAIVREAGKLAHDYFSRRAQLEIKSAVPGYELQHVIQKANAGRDAVPPAALDADPHRHLGF